MPRVNIELPATFHFTAHIPVRITDINYGGHVGNNALLGLLQEARLQYLNQWGYTELAMAGVGLIMSDVVVVFLGESFYGDVWDIQLRATAFSRVGFDIFYAIGAVREGRSVRIAEAKTGMICFDYAARKPVAVPAVFVEQTGLLG